MTGTQRASEASAYGRDPCNPDEWGMLWFDWQVESNAASSTACAVVDEANEGAARLLDAPAAELRGRPLRSLFTRECWPEIERELARTDRPAPRTLALELLERGERCAPARARLLAPGRTRGTRGPTLFVLPARARPAARELPPVSALVCTRLARGLLHDLRSPLMAISGFAEVLAFRHAAELGSDARRCVDNIVAATRRL